MQYEQLRSERNKEVLANSWKDILLQLPTAAAHARRRAERQRRDHQPELHLLDTCQEESSQGGHDSRLASGRFPDLRGRGRSRDQEAPFACRSS